MMDYQERNEAIDNIVNVENMMDESLKSEDSNMDDSLDGGVESTSAEANRTEDMLGHGANHEQEIADYVGTWCKS